MRNKEREWRMRKNKGRKRREHEEEESEDMFVRWVIIGKKRKGQGRS